MHIKDSELDNQEGINKKEKRECFRMFLKYLLNPLATSQEATFLPRISPKAFATKSIHLLIISQHTYKMSTCTKFSKWVSLFLIEYIFPEHIWVFFLPHPNTWSLNSIEPGQVACI